MGKALMRDMEEFFTDQARLKGLDAARAKALGRALDRAFNDGLAKGLAKILLRLLAIRGIRVDEPSRQRIQTCSDLAILQNWIDQAKSAAHLSEVLDDRA